MVKYGRLTRLKAGGMSGAFSRFRFSQAFLPLFTHSFLVRKNSQSIGKVECIQTTSVVLASNQPLETIQYLRDMKIPRSILTGGRQGEKVCTEYY